jgi:hypothetical protein
MFYRCCLILFLSVTVSNLPIYPQESSGHARLVMGGTLVAIHGDSISITNDKGTFVVRVNNDTDIWRGGKVPLGELHAGDDVHVAYYSTQGPADMVAIEIDANIANWSGTITRIGPHSIAIAREDEQGNALGPASIFIDEHAQSYDPSELKVGGSLQVVGLYLGNHRMRATQVLTVLPPPPGKR